MKNRWLIPLQIVLILFFLAGCSGIGTQPPIADNDQSIPIEDLLSPEDMELLMQTKAQETITGGSGVTWLQTYTKLNAMFTDVYGYKLESGVVTGTDIVLTLADASTITVDASALSITLGADENYVTDAQLVIIGNTTGTNSGDQDISGIATNATAIAGKEPLIGNPGTSGYIPSRATDGTWSWVVNGSGSGDDLGSALFSDVVGLWGTCSSGYLKFDGSCDTPTGTGTVDISGTPTVGQTAVFVDADTLEGVSPTVVSANVETMLGSADNPTILSNIGAAPTTGILSYAANTQLSTTTVKSSFVIATATMTLELQDTLIVGDEGCFLNEAGDTTVIALNPGDGNTLVVNGVTMTASTNYAATAAAGNKICWVVTSATVAYVTSETGTWSE